MLYAVGGSPDVLWDYTLNQTRDETSCVCVHQVCINLITLPESIVNNNNKKYTSIHEGLCSEFLQPSSFNSGSLNSMLINSLSIYVHTNLSFHDFITFSCTRDVNYKLLEYKKDKLKYFKQ